MHVDIYFGDGERKAADALRDQLQLEHPELIVGIVYYPTDDM